jgi:hypothetical protein
MGEDRHRLLGPDDAHGHELRLCPRRRLDEPAAAEPPQPVSLVVGLLGALAALGENEHELALVVEQTMDVGRMGRNAADLGNQRGEPRVPLEEMLDRDVQRPRTGMLLPDRPRDHRGVGRQRPGVVRDQQGAALRENVLDPLHLAPEPVAVEELDQGAIDRRLDPLGAAPVGDPALGLERGQQLAHLLRGRRGDLVLDVRRLGDLGALPFRVATDMGRLDRFRAPGEGGTLRIHRAGFSHLSTACR